MSTQLRFVLFVVFSWLALTVPSAGQSTSGIEVATSVPDAIKPERWLVMRPGTDNYYEQVRGGSGRVNIQPGRYEIRLVMPGQNGSVTFGPITVSPGQVTTLDLNSGIRLTGPAGAPAPRSWLIKRAGQRDPFMRIEGSWGTALLPSGSYVVEIPTPFKDQVGASDRQSVLAGQVTDVEIGDLGLSHLIARAEKLEDVKPLFGSNEPIEHYLEHKDRSYTLDRSGPNKATLFSDWILSDRAILHSFSGSFSSSEAVDLEPGKADTLEFDLDATVKDRGLSLFRLEDPLDAPGQLSITDKLGNRLLLSDPDGDLSKTYLSNGGPLVRLRTQGEDQQIGPVPGGALQRLTVGEMRAGGSGNTTARTIDLAIETPTDAAVLPADATETQVVGHASTTAEAGTTQIALVIDTSTSTRDGSGADIDGDGQEDSVLAAEIAAASKLIDALHAIDRESPGTAFAVSVVTFAGYTETLAPLSPLSDASAVSELQTLVRAMGTDPIGGSTFYNRGIDAALRTFAADGRPGPKIILLITDGKPNEPGPALDAAARAGLGGVVVHAVGLGRDFADANQPRASYPPMPERGVDVLATMAALGAPGGKVWPLTKPGDVVDLIDDLPIVERADALVESLVIENVTTGAVAGQVQLRRDGTFDAVVPVDFEQSIAASVNTIRITAIAKGSGATAVREVRVQAEGFDLDILADTEREISRLRQRVAELENQISESDRESGEMEQLRKDLDEARTRLAKAQADIEELTKQAEDVEEQRREDDTRNARRIDELVADIAETKSSLAQCTVEEAACTTLSDNRLDVILSYFVSEPAPGVKLVSVPSDVVFETGSYALKSEAETALDIAATVIAEHPRSDLSIEGHTDSIGGSDYNLTLSQQRAQAVADWLSRNKGLSLDRMRTVGFGETKLKAVERTPDGQDDPEGRRKNRRVEIRILTAPQSR